MHRTSRYHIFLAICDICAMSRLFSALHIDEALRSARELLRTR